jgi:hypothetical protein
MAEGSVWPKRWCFCGGPCGAAPIDRDEAKAYRRFGAIVRNELQEEGTGAGIKLAQVYWVAACQHMAYRTKKALEDATGEEEELYTRRVMRIFRGLE